MRILLSLTVSMLCILPAHADQQKTLKANESTVIMLSKHELNRLAFEHDVSNIHMIRGELEADIQGKDIYLRTLVVKPINFFIRTENGDTYKFVASVDHVPAQQILIHHEKGTSKPLESWHAGLSGYERGVLSTVTAHALSPKKHLGFSTKELQGKKRRLSKDIYYHSLHEVSGKGFMAEAIRVENQGNSTFDLTSSQFTKTDTVGIYIQDPMLEPHQHTHIIRIKRG